MTPAKTFIDLFSGIGGFHQALYSLGLKCSFASEIDTKAAMTYSHNYGLIPKGDITKISEEEIPQHDILCAGFPCQAFSISGNRKGFDDARGTLFFEIARIINYHKPKVVFLENVKNLVTHDQGKTFNFICNTLINLEYSVYYKVFNASEFGVPQSRHRVYIIAFHKNTEVTNFSFPIPPLKKIVLEDILEEDIPSNLYIDRDDILYKKDPVKTNIISSLRPIQLGIVGKGGQGERIYSTKGHAITLSAYGGGIGAKTGLYWINGKIRRLSPRECARVQGFPDTFQIIVPKNEAYKQFGNSIAVPVVKAIAYNIIQALKSHSEKVDITSLEAIPAKTTFDIHTSL